MVPAAALPALWSASLSQEVDAALAQSVPQPEARRAVVAAIAAAAEQQRLPPTLSLHSYTGSAEMASQLVKLPHVGSRLFFGFSAAINLRTPRAATPAEREDGAAAVRKVLAAVPPSQVLLESDQSHVKGTDRELTRMLEVLAAAWGVTPRRAAAIARFNAERWRRGLAASAYDHNDRRGAATDGALEN